MKRADSAVYHLHFEDGRNRSLSTSPIPDSENIKARKDASYTPESGDCNHLDSRKDSLWDAQSLSCPSTAESSSNSYGDAAISSYDFVIGRETDGVVSISQEESWFLQSSVHEDPFHFDWPHW